MGKYTPRNPMWPDWFNGKKIDEVTFCGLFLHDHPMKCIDGRFFTPDGPVEDEAILKQLILDEVQVVITHGLSKKVEEIAQILAISSRAAYNLCKSTKDFKVIRIGKSGRVNKQSFDNWLASA